MMNRLTTDKKTSEMNMTELALNSCYVKNGEAWYRYCIGEIATRDFIRKLYKRYTGDAERIKGLHLLLRRVFAASVPS